MTYIRKKKIHWFLKVQNSESIYERDVQISSKKFKQPRQNQSEDSLKIVKILFQNNPKIAFYRIFLDHNFPLSNKPGEAPRLRVPRTLLLRDAGRLKNCLSTCDFAYITPPKADLKTENSFLTPMSSAQNKIAPGSESSMDKDAYVSLKF